MKSIRYSKSDQTARAIFVIFRTPCGLSSPSFQARLSTTRHSLIRRNTKWCVARERLLRNVCANCIDVRLNCQVFDLFTVPSYNGYMAAAYKNYTIDWTPKVVQLLWVCKLCFADSRPTGTRSGWRGASTTGCTATQALKMQTQTIHRGAR